MLSSTHASPSHTSTRQHSDHLERERRVREALPLVQSLVDRLYRRHKFFLPYNDVYALGLDGLSHANECWDPARGASFTTYAFTRIRGTILSGLRTSYAQNRNESVQRGQGPCSKQQLKTDDADSIIDRYCDVTESARCVESPDLGPESQLIRREAAARIRQAINRLPLEQRRVLELYYYGDRDFRAVAAELGYSVPTAWRLHARALPALRSALADLADTQRV